MKVIKFKDFIAESKEIETNNFEPMFKSGKKKSGCKTKKTNKSTLKPIQKPMKFR